MRALGDGVDKPTGQITSKSNNVGSRCRFSRSGLAVAVRNGRLGGGEAGRDKQASKTNTAAFQLSEIGPVDCRRRRVRSAVNCGVDRFTEAHSEPASFQLDNRSVGLPICKCLTN